MNVVLHDVPQRSDAWKALRCGRLTSSAADAMLAEGRGKAESVQRRNLRIRLVLERLTGRSQENGFVSKAMQDGIDREDHARVTYEALTGRLLKTVGFVAHQSLMAGCSPDGYVGDFDGIVEVKSPIAATHLDYLRTGKIPLDYYRQVMHALWVTGAQWCDWLSYQPEFPESLAMKLVRVPRADIDFKAYELMVRMFLGEVEKEFEEVSSMAAGAAV